jgi:hypothetical protein
VIYAIEQGGGKIESDGSRGEYPRTYPRDARDGFKKQYEAKRLQRLKSLAPKRGPNWWKKKKLEMPDVIAEQFRSWILGELNRRMEDAAIKHTLTSMQPRQ